MSTSSSTSPTAVSDQSRENPGAAAFIGLDEEYKHASIITMLSSSKIRIQPKKAGNFDAEISFSESTWKILNPQWKTESGIPRIFLDWKTAPIQELIYSSTVVAKAANLNVFDPDFEAWMKEVDAKKSVSGAGDPPENLPAVLFICVRDAALLKPLLGSDFDVSKGVSPFPEFPGVKVLYRGFGRKMKFWKTDERFPAQLELFASHKRLGFLIIPEPELCKAVFRMIERMYSLGNAPFNVHKKHESKPQWRGLACVLAHPIALKRALDDSLELAVDDIARIMEKDQPSKIIAETIVSHLRLLDEQMTAMLEHARIDLVESSRQLAEERQAREASEVLNAGKQRRLEEEMAKCTALQRQLFVQAQEHADALHRQRREHADALHQQQQEHIDALRQHDEKMKQEGDKLRREIAEMQKKHAEEIAILNKHHDEDMKKLQNVYKK